MWSKQDYVTLFWIVLGGLVALFSYRVGLGRLLEPGPGLMPFGLGAAMCLLALFNLVRGRRSTSKAEQKEIETANKTGLNRRATKIGAITAGLFVYAFLLEPLGYVITTFLAVSFLLKVAGYKQWLRVLPYAAVITLVTYFGFGYLGTRFPQGMLSFPGM
jgi:putative tricarboxylic transport membrane protein